MFGTSLGSLDGFTIVTYDGKELGLSKVSTEGTADDNLVDFLLGALFRAVYGFKLGNNVDAEVGLFCGKPLGTTLGSLDGVLIGT